MTLFCVATTFTVVATQLQWDSPSDATVTGYKIYKSLGSNPFSMIGVTSVTNFVITLDTNQVSRYYVTSTNSSGIESIPSNIVTNYPVVAPVYLTFEAENGAITSPMAINSDTNASGGKFVESLTVDTGTAQYSINVPYTGTYMIWCRVLAPSTGEDSFYVSMDGVEDVYGCTPNAWSTLWQWDRLNGGNGVTIPRTFNLTAGVHTLIFRGREPTKLDKFIVTNDMSYNPSVITAPIVPGNIRITTVTP